MNMAEVKEIQDVEGVPLMLHTVLEQWGKWNRARGTGRSTSSSQLGIFRDNRCPKCYEGDPCAMCIAAGVRVQSAEPLVPPIEVEKALLRLPEKERELLRAHYHRQVIPRLTARALVFPAAAYRLHLRAASIMLRNILLKNGFSIDI